MEFKSKLLPVIFLLGAMLLLSFISAADTITIDLPVADTIVTSDAQNLNMTIDSGSTHYNATWAYNVSSATLVEIGVVTNTTPSQIEFNRIWDTTALTNGVDYCVNVTTRDLLNAVVSSALVCGLWIDNGAPTATLNSSSFSNNLALVVGTTFNVAIEEDDTLGISSCIAFFTEVASPYTVTTQAISADSNGCILTTTPSTESLLANHAYNVLIQATDANTNKTNSTARTLRVTAESAGGGGSSTYTTDNGDGLGGTASGIGTAISNFFKGIADFFKSLKFWGN